MTDTVTISRECIAWFLQASEEFGSIPPVYRDEARSAVMASPPPPSGLREALKQALQQWKMYAEMSVGFNDEGRDLATEKSAEGDLYRIGLAALPSPDDGWVRVTEEAPLPDDLKIGDEIIYRISQVPGSNWFCNEYTAYRRRPSAEQGG